MAQTNCLMPYKHDIIKLCSQKDPLCPQASASKGAAGGRAPFDYVVDELRSPESRESGGVGSRPCSVKPETAGVGPGPTRVDPPGL
jgi:hypothetical protein